MAAPAILERGRDAYARRSWREAHDQLVAADGQEPLRPDDLERLALAAYLTGHHDDAGELIERTHHGFLESGEVARAVRWAFWRGMILAHRGQHAQAGGWLGRAQRLLADASLDCVEHGYLLVPVALQALGSGDPSAAHTAFGEALAVAQRFGDPDLAALGRFGTGRALVAMGEATEGVAWLDEAMVTVTTDEVSPLVAGIVYCEVIITCRDAFDLRRAQEWTAALSRWCAGQDGLHPYRGRCLVHRSEIMQLHGDWSAALEEIEKACALAEPPGDPVVGMARYQRAELLRLRGAFDEAEDAYRQASEWGHSPHPGLALLRLAQGRVDHAAAAIRRVVDETTDDRVRRAPVLAAYVEIMVAADDAASAGTAIQELEQFAEDFDTPYVRAVTASARGAVLLATGDASAACTALSSAWRAWQQLDAPYEVARARLVMARACQQLGDDDSATMELDAARRIFEQLAAAPALARVAELSTGAPTGSSDLLTPREVEVLRLVATGATNRQVADRLVISEKTVARHLSNMFTKLGLSTRAAATAWAYEHDLV